MPNIYPKYKHLLEEDKLITVKGKISLRNEIPSVVAEEIIEWGKSEQEEQVNYKKLYIRFNTKNFDEFQKIKKSLSSYSGKSPVIIKCTDCGKAFSYSETVEINNYLLNELYGIVGESNVVVK